MAIQKYKSIVVITFSISKSFILILITFPNHHLHNHKKSVELAWEKIRRCLQVIPQLKLNLFLLDIYSACKKLLMIKSFLFLKENWNMRKKRAVNCWREENNKVLDSWNKEFYCLKDSKKKRELLSMNVLKS